MKRTLIASILMASIFNAVNAQNSIEPKSIPDPIYKASTIPKCNYTPVLNFIGRVKWGNSTSYGTSASCYSYVQFQGDDEKDCIIKFNYYGSGRKLIDKSTTKLVSKHYDDGLLAYQNGADVFFRLDSMFCSSVLNAQAKMKVEY